MECGFKPSKILIAATVAGASDKVWAYLYDKDISPNNQYYKSNTYYTWQQYEFPITTNSSGIYDINDTGFRFRTYPSSSIPTTRIDWMAVE